MHLMRPTRKLGRAALKRFSIWSCTGRGLPSFSSHLENWCALTAPFHPYLSSLRMSGGLLSVALSFTLLRLHVMERPALRCSDFPPDLSIPRSFSLVRPYIFLGSNFSLVLISLNCIFLGYCKIKNSITLGTQNQAIGALHLDIKLVGNTHVTPPAQTLPHLYNGKTAAGI